MFITSTTQLIILRSLLQCICQTEQWKLRKHRSYVSTCCTGAKANKFNAHTTHTSHLVQAAQLDLFYSLCYCAAQCVSMSSYLTLDTPHIYKILYAASGVHLKDAL